MTETRNVFNYVSVANQNERQGDADGKAGAADAGLELLLLLEMYKDKPEMQKLIEQIEKRRKLKGKNAFREAAKRARAEQAAKLAFKTASGRAAIDNTVMMNAAAHNRIEMLLKQIKRGKAFGQKNEFGQTAESLAKAAGNSQILEWLYVAKNYLILLEKNAYHISKDPTRSHFLNADQKKKLSV